MASYKSDIEIAQSCEMEHILTIAKRAHVDEKYIEQYGNYKAKIDLSLLNEATRVRTMRLWWRAMVLKVRVGQFSSVSMILP